MVTARLTPGKALTLKFKPPAGANRAGETLIMPLLTGGDMQLQLMFLGTGTSQGVPIIGCPCPVCTSADPRDRRMRPSVALRTGDGRVVLIDTTPELRLQALAAGLTRCDAVLYTHHHADHVMGMDDLRAFNQRNGHVIPCYADERTIENLRRIFYYAEVPADQPRHPDRPGVSFHAVQAAQPFELLGLRITPLPLEHYRIRILGYRIEPADGGPALAYCTDVSAVPEETVAMLAGVDTLVLGALRHRPHPAHMSLSQSLEAAGRIAAGRTWFTHMNHDLPHAATNAALPPDKQLAHDGLTVTIGHL
ncbi:MAG: Phosphoribosyl 1,2-cyclic phosphate phosphodiesterase [Phycisphaerae bacterium]|nr:Phosphoribosyl 1,2-cyclic phosphate phosphodiesterase [Phycisphaerae bacterium]